MPLRVPIKGNDAFALLVALTMPRCLRRTRRRRTVVVLTLHLIIGKVSGVFGTYSSGTSETNKTYTLANDTKGCSGWPDPQPFRSCWEQNIWKSRVVALSTRELVC